MRRRLAIALPAALTLLALPTAAGTQEPLFTLTKAAPASANVGERFTYTLTARPERGARIQNVRVRDDLPARVRFVSINAGAFTCARDAGGVTCTLASLPAARSFEIVVEAAETGVATNDASATAVFAPDFDNPSNVSSRDSTRTTIDTAADLTVRKTGADRVNVGDNLTYTVRATNNGPSPARGVTVRDDLPDSVDIVRIGNHCSRAGTVVTCNAGTLGSGAGQAFEIVVRPRQPGTLVNQTTVRGDTRDPNGGNNSDALRTLVTSADLVVEKSAPARAGVGDRITYTLTVRNAGPNTAEAVVLRDELPADVGVVTLDQRCSRAGQVVTCNLGAIADGARESVALVVRPTAAGTLTNTARVSSGTFDPNGGNNSATARTVVTSADVSVTKLAPIRVAFGDEFQFRLSVRNRGPSRALGVVLVDRLPQGVVLVSRGGCTASGLQVRCPLGTLREGARRERVLVVRARVAGAHVNRAEVSSSTFDPRRRNNTDSTRTIVEERKDEQPVVRADLSVEKNAPAAVKVGETIRYAIVARNAGPRAADAVVVRDDLPRGADVVTLDSRCQREDRVLTCPLGALAAGAQATIVLVLRAREAGKLTNRTEVTSSTEDPDRGNNVDETPTDVEEAPHADVGIEKTGPRRVRVGETVRYVLRVRNAGPGSASAVVVRDELPGAIQLVSVATSCTTSGSTVTCTLGTLARGAVRTIMLTVVPSAPGRLTNRATVITTTEDRKKGNDSDRARTRVLPNPVPRLVLTPLLGQPGFAPLATGTGFPPRAAIALRWRPGLGVPVRVRADRNGAFRVRVLVLPKDRLGRRQLVATPKSSANRFNPVAARFLVVPPTVQPSSFVVRG